MASDGREDCHTGPRDLYELDDAPDPDTFHGRLAWPVAEKMLQMLASNKTAWGFKPSDFVKESFQEAFATPVTSTDADSSRQKAEGSRISGNHSYSIVDAALGTMGYKATTICDGEIRVLVDTLTALVQSRVSCGSCSLASTNSPELSRGQKNSQGNEKFPGCKQSISASGLLQMVEKCIPFLATRKASGTQVMAIVDAFIRVATDRTLFVPLHAMYRKTVSANEGQTSELTARALQSLVDYAFDKSDLIHLKLQPSSRLRFWRMRPLCLKQELSGLAHGAMERMLLEISRELFEREELASVVVCLSLAPDMFREARRHLHSWFMSSGSIRMWELRAAVVAAVWNVLNRPSVWGFVDEVYLPPQHAFYHTSLRPFVQILRWTPTLTGLVKLVKLLDHGESLNQISARACQGSVISGEVVVSQISDKVNHDSIWALLMDFMPWFHFACRILFDREGCEQSPSAEPLEAAPKRAVAKTEVDGTTSSVEGFAGQSCRQVSARYIVWIMNPLDSRLRDSDEQMLFDLTSGWDEVQKAMHIGRSPSISVLEDPCLLQSCVLGLFLKCSRCGVPVGRAKKENLNASGADAHKRIDETMLTRKQESVASLNLWLADLQAKFGNSDRRNHMGEKVCVAKDGNVGLEWMVGFRGDCNANVLPKPSSSHSDHRPKLFMISFLALAALAGSLTQCSYHIVARMLQFVSNVGKQTMINDLYIGCPDLNGCHVVPTCNSACSVVHCNLCCLQGIGRLSKSDGTQAQVDGVGNGTSPQFRHLEALELIPGVAAVFNFLDSMHDNDFSRTNTAHSEHETGAAQRKVNENLAVILSELVNQWGSTFEAPSSSGVFVKGFSKEGHIATLEDMRRRFCAWIRKLKLSTEVQDICESAQVALDVRIANLKSFLITM